MREEQPLFEENLLWGTKSANPLLDKSSIYWAATAPRNVGIDVADFYPEQATEFAKALGDAGKILQRNRIVRLLPQDAMIYGTGPSLIEVSKPSDDHARTRRPGFRLAGRPLSRLQRQVRVRPGGLYVIAERSGAGRVHFSGERFAWFAPDLYLAGDVRFAAPPERTAGAITVHGEAIGGGALKLWSPVPPKAVLANGKAIKFDRTAGYWEFAAPKDLSILEIDF